MSLAAMFVAAAIAAGPLPTPPVYVTPNYALTFQPPKNTTYCPLPKGWVGSDHGTVLFLVPPKRCGGDAGYPSSGRGFSPDVPRIEVYYGYWEPPDPVPASRCRMPMETMAFMGLTIPACIKDADGMTTVTVQTTYPADSTSEVILTLVTTSERLEADLKALRDLAASTHSCRVTDTRVNYSFGTGAPCPPGKWF